MTDSFPFGDLAVNLAVAAAAALALMVVTFLVGLLRGKHSVVDVAWGLGFVAVGVLTYCFSVGVGDDSRRLLVMALTVVWGVRLAVYIAARNWGYGEDPRYDKLLSRAPGNRNLRAFLLIYLTQGAVLWVISLPIQVAAYESAPLNWISIVGVAVWAVGFVFESVGDWQLARFKARRGAGATSKTVMDTGLWRYTRHPNYFGDACVWWGLFLLACGHWVGLLTVVSPLLINYVIVKRTGKKLLEAQLSETKPGYRDYIERTSGFFPLPPKRRA
jgi:steroid 5-alpha reductase family enzyme